MTFCTSVLANNVISGLMILSEREEGHPIHKNIAPALPYLTCGMDGYVSRHPALRPQTGPVCNPDTLQGQ